MMKDPANPNDPFDAAFFQSIPSSLMQSRAVEAFFLVHLTAINDCRKLSNQVSTMVPNHPRRGKNEGPSSLMPLYSGQLDFGVNGNFDGTVSSSNVLIAGGSGANAPSSSNQATMQGRSQQNSHTGQQQSFRHIAAGYRRFAQSSGVGNNGPLSVYVDAEKDGEANPSTSQSYQPAVDLDVASSLASFFRQTESSPRGSFQIPLNWRSFIERC